MSDYLKIISRSKLPFFKVRIWKLEAGQALNNLNLSYEEKLVLLHELSEMTAGYFRNASLLRRSKNKLQILLESQTHLGVKVMYILGIKRRGHKYVTSDEIKEYSY